MVNNKCLRDREFLILINGIPKTDYPGSRFSVLLIQAYLLRCLVKETKLIMCQNVLLSGGQLVSWEIKNEITGGYQTRKLIKVLLQKLLTPHEQ